MKPMLLAFVFAMTASSEPADRQEIMIQRGTIKVLATKKKNAAPVPGTAIMIGTRNGNTYFLTAWHVVAGARQIRIQTFENREGVDASVWNNKCEEQLDLAVLVVPSYLLGQSVEQIEQTDPTRLRVSDRVTILGQSPGNEWVPRKATLKSIETNEQGSALFVEPNVVQDGDSGGPMLDSRGGLVGIIVESTNDGRGRAVRLDTALAVLQSWKVPYRVWLRVDFCQLIGNAIEWSKNEFNDIKGTPVDLRRVTDVWGYFREGPEWQLRDASMDITGEGRSRLLAYRGNTVYYLAKFGEPADLDQAQRLQSSLARLIQKCLPNQEPMKTNGNCLTLWTPQKRMSFHEPASFDVYLNPKSFEVELFMYRKAVQPIDCKSK